MVAVPAERAVTSPVDELMVATDVLEDCQLPPVAVDVKLEVDPIHSAWVPLSVPALGGAVTVTDRVAVAVAQPPVPATL